MRHAVAGLPFVVACSFVALRSFAMNAVSDIRNAGSPTEDWAQRSLRKWYLPRGVTSLLIATIMVWGALAPVKEYFTAYVVLETGEEKDLKVKPNLEGYAVFALLLQQFVNLTFPGSVPHEASDVIDVPTNSTDWDQIYVQYYLGGIFESVLPVDYDVDYEPLLRDYELFNATIHDNMMQATMQICQTYNTPEKDTFTAGLTTLPTVWAKPMHYSDMGCPRDTKQQPNSPHTWLGGMMCIGGYDVFAKSEQILTWAGYTRAHNVWKYNREFWEEVYGSLGPCVNSENGTVLDGVKTLQRLCREHNLNTTSCLMPVHWLLNADTPAVWNSNGGGVLNINSKFAFSSRVESYINYPRSFESSLTPLMNPVLLLGDMFWQLFYTSECGSTFDEVLKGTAYSDADRQALDACYRRFYSLRYMQGYTFSRSTSPNAVTGAVSYDIEQNLTADPMIHLPPRAVVTPTEAKRIGLANLGRAINYTKSFVDGNATVAGIQGLVICAPSCAAFCVQSYEASTIDRVETYRVVSRRPGGACSFFILSGSGVGEGASKCIRTKPIENDPWEYWAKSVIVYTHNATMWHRLETIVPGGYVDLACALTSVAPPGGVEQPQTPQQLRAMEAFLLRFAFLRRIEVGMITDKLIVLDPSLAMTQILSVLFTIGTVAYCYQMVNLLRMWRHLRHLYDSSDSPSSLSTLLMDFAGIAYQRNRLREFTMCSSIKVIASWYTTSYTFHITSMGISLDPYDPDRNPWIVLVGMTTSVWLAMECLCMKGNKGPVTKLTYVFIFFAAFAVLYALSPTAQQWNAQLSRSVKWDEFTSAVTVLTIIMVAMRIAGEFWWRWRKVKTTFVEVPLHWRCRDFLHGLQIYKVDARIVEATPVDRDPDADTLLDVVMRQASLSSMAKFDVVSSRVRGPTKTNGGATTVDGVRAVEQAIRTSDDVQ